MSGPGWNSQFQQVTAHDDGKRSATVHCQLLCPSQQPLAGGKSIKRFRWTACVVGPRDTHQSVDAVDLFGQSSNRTVRSVGVMQRTGAEMAAHKRDHLIDEVMLVRQSFEKTSRRGLSFRFMSA